MGALSSVVLDREIGNWARFRNRRQVGSYTGLCPGEYSSGKTRHQSCVTKHGNPRLRAALVEASRSASLRAGCGDWFGSSQSIARSRNGHHLLGKGALATGPARKKAIVAVARQLAVDLWRIRTGRVQAEELGLI